MKYLFLLILIPFSLSAQDLVIPLWIGDIPNYVETGEKEQVGNVGEKFEMYTSVINPDISVYFPSKKSIKKDKVILVIPGGAYGAIVYKWEGSSIAKFLSEKGFTAIVLKYRLPNSKSSAIGFKSPLLDAERAMRLIKSNADKWGIKQVGVMGFSAGGHLASTLGTHFDVEKGFVSDDVDSLSSRPDFMVLMYPVITMDSTFTHIGSRNNLLGDNPSKDLIEFYSNEKQVTKSTPPTFIVHSMDDDVVPVHNSLVFYNTLQKHKINSELHIYQYGGHGFALAEGRGYLETWKHICIEWINNIK